ncbi:hypothetical protein FB567DRAFT_539181 [Paraphoma chrysanthemicola]|uniref:NmrA-like domain-containing protein n=1 Tax=Paraphoma chrysanthemicola TaxID=798071 RepID=A0A8K0VTB5_9PLEO|nr:hypothetical protein FB567DRAFT_539181 [Paraphoma chrysanthemicola]
MAPTFLIVGATGNTGVGVVETLSKDLTNNSTWPNVRILAQTRSKDSSSAQKLAKLPGVEILAKPWIEITSDWLREHEVVRAFIASHNLPNHFAEESTFLVEALNAGVEYVVRISTTAANVRPDFLAYYPRQHWAIEAMLGTPEFEKLHWSSLQPNVFYAYYINTAADLIKKFRKDGKQDVLRLMASEDGPVGVIEGREVGVFAAKLLLEKDTTKHNKAKYVLNGPEDLTGKKIVEMVEGYIGQKVENVSYKDLTFLEHMAAQSNESREVIMSIRHAPVTGWDGKCTASTTSKEVLEIAAPKVTPAQALKAMLEE